MLEYQLWAKSKHTITADIGLISEYIRAEGETIGYREYDEKYDLIKQGLTKYRTDRGFLPESSLSIIGATQNRRDSSVTCGLHFLIFCTAASNAAVSPYSNSSRHC